MLKPARDDHPAQDITSLRFETAAMDLVTGDQGKVGGASALHGAYVAFRHEVVRHHDKADWLFLLEAAVELIDIAAHDMTHMSSPTQEARLHQLAQTIEQVIRDADMAGASRAET